uniref:Protein-tyrosine phosphatase n=1 Tax=Ascaris lumbricoides TaxID=6252 RepID=A0A0M3ITB1_ASCLU
MVPLKLLSYVRETRAPCVVHCSAGIGRTGTVIAIEMGIRRFLEGKRVDLATVFLFFHSYNQFRLEVTSAIIELFRWPDRGIPNHESAMVPLKLLSYVRETRAPCVVHCSAGIGRTGTVIAIEMGIRRFLEGKRVDLATVLFFFHSYNQFRLEVTSAIM